MSLSTAQFLERVGCRGSGALARLFGRLVAATLVAASVVVAAPTNAVALGGSDTTTPCASSPFVASPAKKTWYRGPAIVQNAQGDLLAFAERRDNDHSDFGDFDIVMRKSVNGGRTWGSLKTIADDGKNRVSSPVPIFDPQSGDVLLFTAIRYANNTYKGVFLQRSTDGGNTFTPLSSGNVRPQGSFKGGQMGPGHGIVLTKGTHAGRIIFAMGHRKGDTYGAYGIYSDDGGETWKIGYDYTFPSGEEACIEGTIAELPSGVLFISYRDKLSTTPGKTRLHAYSSDGGKSLSAGLAPLLGVKIHSVECSALNPAGSHSGVLLFSAPAYTTSANRTLRRDMGIFYSKDGGATWGKPYWVGLQSKPAAYSDLVQMNDGTVGILYETGIKSWRERIAFRRVSISEITKPTKLASSVKASPSRRTTRTRWRTSVRVTVAAKGRSSPTGWIRGTKSPTGKIVVKFVSAKRRGARTVSLKYTNHGSRRVTLPRLKKGTYKITVTYKGNPRIKPKTVSAGKLVVRR